MEEPIDIAALRRPIRSKKACKVGAVRHRKVIRSRAHKKKKGSSRHRELSTPLFQVGNFDGSGVIYWLHRRLLTATKDSCSTSTVPTIVNGRKAMKELRLVARKSKLLPLLITLSRLRIWKPHIYM